MLVASRWPFLRVEGVELNEDLARIAQNNITTWQKDDAAEALAAITLHHADATKFELPHAPTLAFLFHPFELPILKRFLLHVEQSITEHPRPFDLAYVNAEHDMLLDRHPAFTRLWTGNIPMSAADHVADLEEIAQQKEYGSTGDELCSIYRFTGRSTTAAANRPRSQK